MVSICALYFINIKSVDIVTLEQNNNPRTTPSRDLSQEVLSTIEILLQQGRQFLENLLNCFLRSKQFQIFKRNTGLINHLRFVGDDARNRRGAERMYLSCYWVFAIAVVATFTGNLMALMAVKKYNIPVNTLEELAAQPRYQAGVVDGVALADLFRVRMVLG